MKDPNGPEDLNAKLGGVITVVWGCFAHTVELLFHLKEMQSVLLSICYITG